VIELVYNWGLRCVFIPKERRISGWYYLSLKPWTWRWWDRKCLSSIRTIVF
jgi:hypothetical protein